MTEMLGITDVRPLEGFLIEITFTDGVVKEIDMSAVFARGGVFTPIYESRELFEQVRVNPESQTVEWPGEIDFDPDVLYGNFEPASGVWIGRRTIKEPAHVK
jgi:hypothetical protein